MKTNNAFKKVSAQSLVFPAMLFFIRTVFSTEFFMPLATKKFAALGVMVIFTAAAGLALSYAVNTATDFSNRFGIFAFAALLADPLIFTRVHGVWNIIELGLFAVVIAVLFSDLKQKPVIAVVSVALLVIASPRSVFTFAVAAVLVIAADYAVDKKHGRAMLTASVCSAAAAVVLFVGLNFLLNVKSFVYLCQKLQYLVFPINGFFSARVDLKILAKALVISLPLVLFSVKLLVRLFKEKSSSSLAVLIIVSYVLGIAALFVKGEVDELAALNAAPLFIILYAYKKGFAPVKAFAVDVSNKIKKTPAIAFIGILWLGACAFIFNPYTYIYENVTKYLY